MWAAGSASRMPALANKVPSYVDCVTIAGEADAGRADATTLAEHDARPLLRLRFLGDEEARGHDSPRRNDIARARGPGLARILDASPVEEPWRR